VTDLLSRALGAAGLAGRLLLDERPDQLLVESKSSATDAVTQMDRSSEELLVRELLRQGPNDGVLGEEGGERPGSSGVRWILDPLDGTVNYLYRLPVWAVSVAAEVDGTVMAGVVHAPALDRTWFAARGEGAWSARSSGEAQPIGVGAESDLAAALLGTGFGYAAADRVRQARRVAGLIGTVRDIRRAGAAAVDLCWVADGSVDLYFEEGTHVWDRAAAGLIVTEAGGVMRDVAGGEPSDDMTIAGNAGLAAQLADRLAAG
jgi:myo-inositol-1(or 4)-monophosphatase